MSDTVQRMEPWVWFTDDGEEHIEISANSLGRYLLHADLVKIFAWMVEHRAEFKFRGLDWRDGDEWHCTDVPDGDFLAAIVRLMGVDNAR